MNKYIYIFIIGLLPTVFTTVHGRNNVFNFSCQRIFNANQSANTQILLELPALDTFSNKSEYKVNFQFRKGNRLVYEISRFVECTQERNLFEFWLNLPDGYYEVWAEAQLVNQSFPMISTQSFQGRDLLKPCVVSDVILLNATTGKPVLDRDIPGSGQKFNFSCEVYASNAGLITARAVLYHQDENPYSDAAGKYSSLGQYSIPVQVDKNGRFKFESALPAESLESGSYLIEIFIYQEDLIIAESNLSFNILWQNVPKILLNPERYLPYMVWKFPDRIVPAALWEGDAFFQYWKLQNETENSYPYAALEEYFQRVNASDAFTGYPESWKNALGKYYILLGTPDSIEKKIIGEDSVLTWRFHAPPLCKYFIKPEGTNEWEELSSSHTLRLSLN
jgi:GWxTD domain-containing protein